MTIDFSKIGQPCDLHELTGCSICSGLDKQLAAEDAEALPKRIAPGVVLSAWPGKCAFCGADFPKGEAIRYSNAAGGWTPVSGACC
jgi:hypothetical protein